MREAPRLPAAGISVRKPFRNNRVPVKRLAVPLLAAGVFLAAVRGPALEIPLAPDYVLQWAQGNVARGTDFLAQGEFYLAENNLKTE